MTDPTWLAPVAVAIGSGLGGVARFWASAAVTRCLGAGFPWGTLAVNATGALLAGAVVAGLPAISPPGQASAVHFFLLVGLCGSYTTVSSFALQTFTLVYERRWPAAIGNVLASLALSLAAAWLGLCLGEGLAGGGLAT